METGMDKDEMQGLPGEPGEPGEPGIGGGGAGGHGGRGGRGGHGGSYATKRSYRYLLAISTIVAIVLCFTTLVIAHNASVNSDKIKRLQQENRRDERAAEAELRKSDKAQLVALLLVRQAEYRICVRQMVTRAAMVFDKHHDEPDLKLYDCRPNLVGKAATLLTPAERIALFRTIKAGKAP